ncbi:hypothetical protein JDV09_12385 [Mycobacterium sp. Y57]|nr:hypothetical protein [Mycolicibacterium xanthum]
MPAQLFARVNHVVLLRREYAEVSAKPAPQAQAKNHTSVLPSGDRRGHGRVADGRSPGGSGGLPGCLDVVPDLLAAHQPEPDLQVGVAQPEPVGDAAKRLGVRVVVLLDAPVIGAAGNAEGVEQVLGVDLTVE